MNYTYNTQQQQPMINQQQYMATPMVRPMTSYQPMGGWNVRVRPVSSVEEVRASSIDFDGSIFYFPDIANKKIYTKFINMDGSVVINMYELKEMPTGKPVDNAYITREEFEQVISQLKMGYDNNFKEDYRQEPQINSNQNNNPIFQF